MPRKPISRGPSRVVSLTSNSTIETLRLIDLSRIESYAIFAQAIGYIYLQDISSAGSSIFGFLSSTPIIEIGGSEEDIKNFDQRWNCFNQTVYPYPALLTKNIRTVSAG